ncbi:MAG: hydroxyacid dehydrogenase, partial [Candidatus Omnitrophica bacterium]|nr:hydroxyacid dehydrogenase [Candidatus Omnitrophota bacterium]
MALKIAVGPSSFAQEDSTPLDLLMKAGLEIVPNPFGRRLTEDEIIEHLKGVDGLIAGLEPLNRKVIESAPQLKAIARVGIGVTNVDFQAAEDCGVKVSNTPDPPAAAVAELTLAALLSLARKLPSSNEA